MLLLRGILILISCSVSLALEKTVCEHLLDTLDCLAGRIIQIDSVLYGRTHNNVCNYQNLQSQSLTCRSTSISTSAVRRNCEGRNACIVQADSNFLGEDPCSATPKYLNVKYRCVITLGQPLSTTVPKPTSLPTTSTPRSTSTPSTTPTTTKSTTTKTSTRSVRSSVPASRTTIARTAYGNQSHTNAAQCHEYLVSGARGVPDSQLSASSQLSINNNAHRARLHIGVHKYSPGLYLEGAWTADPADSQPWLQVKMNWLTMVTGIMTQGRHVNKDTGCCVEWTSQYVVRYSLDGQQWDTVKDKNGQNRIFIGNTDSDTVITHTFDCPFVARFVRVEVIKYNSRPSLRLDLLGCPTNADDLGKCQKGWKERPGTNTCYFIADQKDTLSWEDAMLMCKRRQAEVVKIDSIQEKQWIQNELQALQKSSPNLSSWWIGLNNRPRFDNTNYKWHDGTPLDTSVLQWQASEPNNAGGKEHCAAYSLFTDSLHDLNCDMKLPLICESSKYWLTPLNTPGLVTRQPTVAPANIPTTIVNKVPIPSGYNPINTGPSTFFTGCFNPSDCVGKAWGDYPSCNSCGSYLVCAPSGQFIQKCNLNLKYDANVDACKQRSSTCTGP